MAQVRLRPWRLTDAKDVAVMIGDEHLGHWSTMGDDLDGWIRREVDEVRGPTRAICLPDDDRALGRVALRPRHSPRKPSAARPCSSPTSRRGN